MAKSDVNMKGLFVILILIVLATALAPTIFENTSTLEADTNTPGWVSAVVTILAGFGIVMLIYKAVA